MISRGDRVVIDHSGLFLHGTYYELREVVFNPNQHLHYHIVLLDILDQDLSYELGADPGEEVWFRLDQTLIYRIDDK